MARVKNTQSSGKLKPKSGKKRKWSVKVDEILQVILKDQRITDPNKQMMVCDVLCDLGLARLKVFLENTHRAGRCEYTSTGKMRMLTRKWVL